MVLVGRGKGKDKEGLFYETIYMVFSCLSDEC